MGRAQAPAIPYCVGSSYSLHVGSSNGGTCVGGRRGDGPGGGGNLLLLLLLLPTPARPPQLPPLAWECGSEDRGGMPCSTLVRSSTLP